jgi:hypothetical protein
LKGFIIIKGKLLIGKFRLIGGNFCVIINLNLTMSQIENLKEKEGKDKQVIEGRIDDIERFEREEEYWKKILPQGVTPNDVDVYIKNENGKSVWYWHLIPDLIKDDKEREEWEKTRRLWP